MVQDLFIFSFLFFDLFPSFQIFPCRWKNSVFFFLLDRWMLRKKIQKKKCSSFKNLLWLALFFYWHFFVLFVSIRWRICMAKMYFPDCRLENLLFCALIVQSSGIRTAFGEMKRDSWILNIFLASNRLELNVFVMQLSANQKKKKSLHWASFSFFPGLRIKMPSIRFFLLKLLKKKIIIKSSFQVFRRGIEIQSVFLFIIEGTSKRLLLVPHTTSVYM